MAARRARKSVSRYSGQSERAAIGPAESRRDARVQSPGASSGGQCVVWPERSCRAGGLAEIGATENAGLARVRHVWCPEGAPITGQSQLVYNGTALAERALSDRMPGITTKALARAAVKFAAAEAATRGSQHAVNKGDAPWVGLLVVGPHAWSGGGVRSRRYEELAHVAG
jgi:hypothetical protein